MQNTLNDWNVLIIINQFQEHKGGVHGLKGLFVNANSWNSLMATTVELWFPRLGVSGRSCCFLCPPHHTWDHRPWDLFYSEIWQKKIWMFLDSYAWIGASPLRKKKVQPGWPSVPMAALRGQLSWVMQWHLSDIIPTPTQRLTWSNSDNWSTPLGKKLNKGGSKERRLTFRLFLIGCDGAYEVLGSHVDLRIAVLTYDLQGGKVAENLVGSGVGSYPVLILHHLKNQVPHAENGYRESKQAGQSLEAVVQF